MSTLGIAISIALPILTYLIGRYQNYQNAKDIAKAVNDLKIEISKWRDSSIANQQEVNRLLDYCERIEAQLTESHRKYNDLREKFDREADACFRWIGIAKAAPKFQVVKNTQKHPAANDNYLYIEGEINGNREAGLLKLLDWTEAKERLLKNPEDKPQ